VDVVHTVSVAERAAVIAVPQTIDETFVRKRALDERDYKSLTLDNGLRVLLVSDPKSNRSAAAIDVNVGYFSDPKELPGLAHFCEHMSFLGTKKYPQEEEFSTFLAANGGSSNAYTDSEDTVYVSTSVQYYTSFSRVICCCGCV
jgi:secreted Zn-dependent insulinase-like peptidase